MVAALRGLAFGWMVAWCWSACAAPSNPNEVKAAFLYNFGKYVEWPPSLRPTTERFSICVVGPDPFGGALERLAETTLVQGRRVRVTPYDPRANQPCQIAVVNAAETQGLQRLLTQAVDAHMLTVSDMDGFVEHGGMIQLLADGRRIRFAINRQAAERAGLKLSSQLLRLASTVQD